MNTYSEIFMLIGLIWAVIATGLLIVAWRAARSGDIARHRLIMIISTLAAWVFIAGYILRYRFADSVPQIPLEYIPWFAIHGTVAMIPFIGATCLVWARLSKSCSPAHHLNLHHIRYGRVLILLWCFTHLGGIANFWIMKS
ncbi:hypothetical protein MNBD_GAMMA26-38 [hydrothermal vent metagenome]|uniref:DUF420 domain-containing protein n=1 Tax=hydrothermal vent metagenome TaxID=652676 RepID=A0A3B1BBF0_9ZZZZ